MKIYWSAICLLLTGCINEWTNWTASSLARQIPDYEEQVVVDNLKAFDDDPDAIPFQPILTGVTSGASTTGGLGENYTAAINAKAGLVLAPTWTGSAQGGFNLTPVTDREDLARLKALYIFAWNSSKADSKSLFFKNYIPPYLKNTSGGPAICYQRNHKSNSVIDVINNNDKFMKNVPVDIQKVWLSPPSAPIVQCNDVPFFVWKLSPISNNIQEISDNNIILTTTEDSDLGLLLSSPLAEVRLINEIENLSNQTWIKHVKDEKSCDTGWDLRGYYKNGLYKGQLLCVQPIMLHRLVNLVMAATPNTAAAGGGGGAGGAAGGGGGAGAGAPKGH